VDTHRVTALHLANSIADRWLREGSSLPPCKIPVQFLIDSTRDYLRDHCDTPDYKIAIKQVPGVADELELVRSGVFIGDQYAEIRLRKGLNSCWQRFCIAKELIHIVFDRKFEGEHRFTIEQADEVSEAIVYTNIFSNVWTQIPLMKWEKIGREGGTILLVPKKYREMITMQIPEEDLDASVLKWAETLKIPAKALDSYLHPKDG